MNFSIAYMFDPLIVQATVRPFMSIVMPYPPLKIQQGSTIEYLPFFLTINWLSEKKQNAYQRTMIGHLQKFGEL